MIKIANLLNKITYFLIGFVSCYTYLEFVTRNTVKNQILFRQNGPKQFVDNLNEIINFEGFNNVTGFNVTIVPNIIHYVHFNQTELEFYFFLSILSVWINHKPDLIYFHCDKCNYGGKYWKSIKKLKDLYNIIIIKEIKTSKREIFGKEPGWIHHLSDVYRLLVLMNYGGIYLDNDMIVVNSLNKYRHYEMCVSWKGTEDGIGNQILIAHKNARFLKSMYDSYRDNYKQFEWYYNGGFLPAKILLNHSYLVHRVDSKLGTEMLMHKLYFEQEWSEWKTFDSIHLVINHRSYLDAGSPIKVFDERNIINYKFIFGKIAREILKKSNAYI